MSLWQKISSLNLITESVFQCQVEITVMGIKMERKALSQHLISWKWDLKSVWWLRAKNNIFLEPLWTRLSYSTGFSPPHNLPLTLFTHTFLTKKKSTWNCIGTPLSSPRSGELQNFVKNWPSSLFQKFPTTSWILWSFWAILLVLVCEVIYKYNYIMNYEKRLESMRCDLVE